MSTSVRKSATPLATRATVTDSTLVVELADGRSISVPLDWYPRLAHGGPEERGRWRLIGGGRGFHWPDLDEDISVEHVLMGKRSGETPHSFRQWLEGRSTAQPR